MVKFDIISGFLGAGKTTLIQGMLKSLKDEKVVIIENEYGETQIDKDVLSIAGFEIYELTNGCVCCTLKADFLLTLKQVLEQKVDRIVFEPSGIFVLSEIQELFNDLQISSRCSLNSITTVIDAQQFNKHINSFAGFFVNQIEVATSLVVSKAQYIDSKEENNIIEELKKINPKAPITVLYSENLTEADALKLLNKKVEHNITTYKHSALDYSCDYDHDHKHTNSDHKFDSIGIEPTHSFDVKDLEEILETAKQGGYGHILRGKGIVKSKKSYLQFNYVDGSYKINEVEKGIRSAVSFIGIGLEKEKIKKVFN